jgi:hypothetical protein
MKKTDEDRENKINGGVFVGLDKRNGRRDERRRSLMGSPGKKFC